MTISAPPPGLQPEDYEEIEAAVMETARGRWFLAEYARRVRRAEGGKLLAALERLEARLEAQGALAPEEAFSVAERLGELSWTLRERGVEDFVCGKIDALAREFAGGRNVRPKRRIEPAPVPVPAQAPPPQEAASAPPNVAQDNFVEGLVAAASPAHEDRAMESQAAQPPPQQPADAVVAPAPNVVASSHAHKQQAREAIEAASEPSPAPPIDPRLAALSWLDRLPLVDRMALFA